MALSDSDGTGVLAAVANADARTLDPLLDSFALVDLQRIQEQLPFFDERLRRAVKRQTGSDSLGG
jgi:hypothetical protein